MKSCLLHYPSTYTSSDGTWIYDEHSRILVLMGSNTHTYTIKALTKVSLTAEWSSVKYGNFTATWTRFE